MYSHLAPMSSPMAGFQGDFAATLSSRCCPTLPPSGKIQIGSFSLEVGAPSNSGPAPVPIALTTVEHCMSAGQTLTVMASFEVNDDGLLCPSDHDAFIYKGTIKSAQHYLQQKAHDNRTWQYICGVRPPPARATLCFPVVCSLVFAGVSSSPHCNRMLPSRLARKPAMSHVNSSRPSRLFSAAARAAKGCWRRAAEAGTKITRFIAPTS